MLSHIEAEKLFESVAPTLTQRERIVAQAISLHETDYGAGWKPGKGQGSHNFGAIMRPANDAGPFFTTQDSRPGKPGEPDVVPFEGRFKVYPDDAAGALDVVKVALKQNVRDAANRGDMQGVAQAMFDNHYYTGTSQTPALNVARYRDALLDAAAKITSETGEPNPFPKAPASPAPKVPAQPSFSEPSASGSLSTLHSGDSGPAVSLLAACLQRLDRGNMLVPLSEVFTPQVERAVKLFQSAHGLKSDGIVGPVTWHSLVVALFTPPSPGYGG